MTPPPKKKGLAALEDAVLRASRIGRFEGKRAAKFLFNTKGFENLVRQSNEDPRKVSELAAYLNPVTGPIQSIRDARRATDAGDKTGRALNLALAASYFIPGMGAVRDVAAREARRGAALDAWGDMRAAEVPKLPGGRDLARHGGGVTLRANTDDPVAASAALARAAADQQNIRTAFKVGDNVGLNLKVFKGAEEPKLPRITGAAVRIGNKMGVGETHAEAADDLYRKVTGKEPNGDDTINWLEENFPLTLQQNAGGYVDEAGHYLGREEATDRAFDTGQSLLSGEREAYDGYPAESGEIDYYVPEAGIPDGTTLRANDDNAIAPLGGIAKEARAAATGSELFYSRLQNAIEKWPQAKATGAQWLSALEKSGTWKAEREWTGVDAFLKSNSDKTLTRAEVMAKARENPVRINEIVRETPQIPPDLLSGASIDHIERILQEMSDPEDLPMLLKSDDALYRSLENNDPEFVVYDITDEEGNVVDHEYNEDWGESLAYQLGYPHSPGPKYAQWTQPGGDNYREILLQLDQNGANAPSFRGGHFPEDNVFAHIRLKDHTLPNGERALFVEEIQSDWNLEGRKQGFARKASKEEIDAARKEYEAADKESKAAREELERAFDAERSADEQIKTAHAAHLKSRPPLDSPEYVAWLDKGNEQAKHIQQLEQGYHSALVAEAHERANAASLRATELRSKFFNALSEGGIPDHPFKRQEDWVGLALKRVIDEAARGGYDRVAWTTGAQQAELYDLSKQVSTVRYKPVLGENGQKTGWGTLSAKDSYGNTVLNQYINDSDLPDYIGRETTERLWQSPRDNRGSAYALEGEDLSVGGEHHKSLYDQVIPNYLKKYAKKQGIKLEIEPTPVEGESRFRSTKRIQDERNSRKTLDGTSSFRVTPDLKDMILKYGQALGMAGGAILAPSLFAPRERKEPQSLFDLQRP